MINDGLTISLSGVTDLAGNALDGEFDNATSLNDPLSGQGSGNGSPGGVFVFKFNALAGDANRDNQVTGADYTIWADNYRTPPGIASSTFSQGDFNGDGFVTGADYTLWSDAFGDVAVAPPAVEPAARAPDAESTLLAPPRDERDEPAPVASGAARSALLAPRRRAAHVDRAILELIDAEREGSVDAEPRSWLLAGPSS
jgi:hypothetical protein